MNTRTLEQFWFQEDLGTRSEVAIKVFELYKYHDIL
jgi:hypothetical protein